MQPNELNELSQYLKEINQATASGQMHWMQSNPTTYVFNSTNGANKIILQKINSTPAVFLFQAIGSNIARLTFNGAENAQVNLQMREIFNAIEALKDQSGLSFLKSILPKQ
jgi:hypothetical protein